MRHWVTSFQLLNKTPTMNADWQSRKAHKFYREFGGLGVAPADPFTHVRNRLS